MIAGEFFIIADTSESLHNKLNDQTYSEIVTKERIRPMNTNPYLTHNPFFKFTIEVPKDVTKVCGPAIGESDTHRHFQSALGLFAVTHDERHNRLICIGFTEHNKQIQFDKTFISARMLVDIHWRSLLEYFEKKEQIVILRSQLNHVDEVVKIADNEYEVMVKVENHLMGYAIGHRGANIQRALKIPGVLNVDRVPVDDKENMFKITGRLTSISHQNSLP